MEKIFVTKASGEKEVFMPEKVTRTLERAGVAPGTEKEILAKVEERLYEGIPTREIYQIVFQELGRSGEPGFSRYGLKQAIMELGPSGYPFERFVAELLKQESFEVQTQVLVEGKCIQHEIDVVAQKDPSTSSGQAEHFMIECKYHNNPGTKTDAKVALYVWGRFLDVAPKFHQAWLVTNTKCTTDALKFCECVGIKVIGWGYPPEGSLEAMIERSGLHPLTILFSLSRSQKQRLLERKIVLCRDLITQEELLPRAGLSSREIELVKNEIRAVCRLEK